MPCMVFKTQRTTRGDCVRVMGENPFTHDDKDFLNEVVDEGGTTVFMCGENAEIVATCKCGHLSDVLCDYPMGRGKTCDLALCSECSHHVGDDLDMCFVHFAMFEKKAKTPRVFGKGPRIVK